MQSIKMFAVSGLFLMSVSMMGQSTGSECAKTEIAGMKACAAAYAACGSSTSCYEEDQDCLDNVQTNYDFCMGTGALNFPKTRPNGAEPTVVAVQGQPSTGRFGEFGLAAPDLNLAELRVLRPRAMYTISE